MNEPGEKTHIHLGSCSGCGCFPLAFFIFIIWAILSGFPEKVLDTIREARGMDPIETREGEQ